MTGSLNSGALGTYHGVAGSHAGKRSQGRTDGGRASACSLLRGVVFSSLDRDPKWNRGPISAAM